MTLYKKFPDHTDHSGSLDKASRQCYSPSVVVAYKGEKLKFSKNIVYDSLTMIHRYLYRFYHTTMIAIALINFSHGQSHCVDGTLDMNHIICVIFWNFQKTQKCTLWRSCCSDSASILSSSSVIFSENFCSFSAIFFLSSKIWNWVVIFLYLYQMTQAKNE